MIVISSSVLTIPNKPLSKDTKGGKVSVEAYYENLVNSMFSNKITLTGKPACRKYEKAAANFKIAYCDWLSDHGRTNRS